MKIISVVGYKKSGKTSLVERLVTELRKHGKVGTIKHMHEHDLNTEGSDTWRHAKAGALVVVGVTPKQLVKFSKGELADALNELADAGMDFGVVEGFKESTLPKIVLGDIKAKNIVGRWESAEHADINEIIDIVLKLPEYHTLKSLIKKVRSHPEIDKAGAIGSFTGIVRGVTANLQTQFLEFEEYSELAKQKMEEICSELKEKEGIVEVVMHHRTGILYKGEDIVYVVVAASHRKQLFPVLMEAIERLKREVPIWKKEHTLEGEWWVHEK